MPRANQTPWRYFGFRFSQRDLNRGGDSRELNFKYGVASRANADRNVESMPIVSQPFAEGPL